MKVQIRPIVYALVFALVAGSSQWLLEADVPAVATGAWAPAGDLGAVPEDTAAVALADGRLVIAGGRNPDGTLISQVGIYDPAARSWEDGGQLVTARAGHTATLLDDGRVLFTGGVTAHGVSFDVEIYDPATHAASHVGDLWVPRVNHAAAALRDGTVLIVGGSNGSTVIGYAEIFNPVTGQTQSLVATLAIPREKLTATTLLDGHVLVAGGRNADGDLAVAELFDPPSQSFFDTGSLSTARSGHVAVLLPNNNQVLIAGGTVAGAPAASAEMYADWRDGFTVVPNVMSQARAGAIAGGLLPYDLAIVAGGGSAAAEFFGYATVKTDKDDYLPGEVVTITGSGWQPGETVSLKISEDADTHYDFTYEAVADANGNIVNTEFMPMENETFHHLGMRFYLVAKGAASQALNTFTDGDKVSAVYLGAQSPSPVSKGSAATYGVSVTATSNANSNVNASLSLLAGTSSVPAGVTVSPGSRLLGKPGDATTGKCVAGRGVPAGQECYDSFNVSVLTTAATPAGSYGLKLRVDGGGNDIIDADFTLVVGASQSSTVVSCAPNPVAVNAPATCTATVTDTSAAGATTPAGTVTFDSSGPGTFGASSCVLSTGANPASCSVSYTPTMRGTGSHAITGSFTATSDHANSSSSPFTLTVNRAAQATFSLSTPASIGYGATDSASATGGSGSGEITFSAGTSTGCSIDATTGVITATNVTGSCAISVTKAADDDYLAATAGPNAVGLSAAALNVVADAKTKQYGASDPELTYAATGFKFNDTAATVLTGALARANGENVADGPYAINQGTLAANGNYVINFTGANLTITARPVTVTADAKNKVYGHDDPALTYQVTSGSLVGEDAFSGSLTRASGEAVGDYAIQQGSLALNANYALTYAGANLTITARPVTVTADAKTKVYGHDDPALTYQVTSGSLVGEDAFSGSLTRASGENVGDYPIQQGTLTLGANYALTVTGAKLTITPRAITVTADPQTKTYGDPDPGLTYQLTVGSLAFSDAFTGALSREPGSNVGAYAINQGTLALSANYTLSYVGANLSISPRPATVTADDKSKTYGMANPPLTATVANVVSGDTLDYSLATTATTTSDVGGYAITVTLGANPNYTVTPVNGTLTIVKATQSISFAPIAGPKLYGDVFAVSPSATSGLTVALAASGNCAVAGWQVTVTGVPTCSLTASQPGNHNYHAAENVVRSFAVVYTWSDFLQPINTDGTSVFKLGSTIPVKFRLTDGSASVANLTARIFVAKISNGVIGTETEPFTNVNADAGNVFRYDATAKQYIFNWGTKGLSEGTWQIRVDLGDNVLHVVHVSLRK